MKALVTGATGFVGSHVAERLKKEGIVVAALVRPSSDVSFLKQQNIPLIYGDLQNPASLDNALKGITHVFHCAAVVSDWAEPQEIFQTNVVGTQALLEKAAHAKIERFIYVSTLAVLGMHDHHGTNELAPYQTTGDTYCDTKIEAEKKVIDAHQRLGLPVVIVRPGFIYGPRDRQFLPRVLKFLKTGKFVYIGDGQKILNLTYIDNLVDAILLAARSPGAIGKIYNITDDGKVTRRKLIEAICRETGLPKPTKSIPIPLAKVICTVCETLTRVTHSQKPPLLNRARMKFLALNLDFDISKIRRELGYKPNIPLEVGMKHTIRWFKTSGKWDEI